MATTRRLEAIREHVECPSLLPDGTRIAYKFRTGQQWRLRVLDLETGDDTALTEEANVDDQPAWLSEQSIGYSREGTLYRVFLHDPGPPMALRPGSSPAVLFPT